MAVAFGRPYWGRPDVGSAVHGPLVPHHKGSGLLDHGFSVDLVRLLYDLRVDDIGVEHSLDLGQLRRCQDMQRRAGASEAVSWHPPL